MPSVLDKDTHDLPKLTISRVQNLITRYSKISSLFNMVNPQIVSSLRQENILNWILKSPLTFCFLHNSHMEPFERMLVTYESKLMVVSHFNPSELVCLCGIQILYFKKMHENGEIGYEISFSHLAVNDCS